MSAVQTDQKTDGAFPPDARLQLPEGVPFTRLLSGIVVVFAIVDIARVGFGATSFPYDYPFYLGMLYLLMLIQMLPRVHRLMVKVKGELVGLADRTGQDDPLFERDTDVDAEQIEEGFEDIIAWAFSPYRLLGGALLSGVTMLGIMAVFGVLQAYPHLLTNFAYGAGHGLFLIPIIGTARLVWKISRKWIVDIDLLDPDGMGGYRQVGDAVVTLVIYVIVFVTIDFLIISSVSYVDNAPFQSVALVMYFGMLVFYGGFTVVGIHLIRERLLELRRRKTDKMREKFREIEQSYWDKQEKGESIQREAEQIRTMQVMFSRLHQMGLWPINLWALFRLAFSTTVSILLVALQEGWIEAPW